MTNTPQKSRYGFYYFPDCNHYTENDLHKWIPELKALGAAWLTLLAPEDRAIPELFIRKVIDAGIQPVLHVPISAGRASNLNALQVIITAYGHWGVKYITLFDRPNLLKNWSPSTWAKSNLVERFLDLYIPLASGVLQAGMIPVFPPLEPGGDYWDTAFLFSALQGLLRRNQTDLLNNLVLSAYAWSGNRSPDWGAGGPERWPRTRPYSTPPDSEDQFGFRIFDWYLASAQAALGKTLPILLLGAGSRIGDQPDRRSPAVDVHAHTWQNMTLVQITTGKSQEYDPLPAEVIGCNFWLLSAAKGDKEAMNAWYQPDSSQLPIVSQLKEWVANSGREISKFSKAYKGGSSFVPGMRPINHYLLLPSTDYGSRGYSLEAIQPFIQKYQPTIGFSPVEASHAKKVTVIGGSSTVPESIIDGLLAAGCIVEQISGDGINIASR